MKIFSKQIFQSVVAGFLLPLVLLLVVMGASAQAEPDQTPTDSPTTLPAGTTEGAIPELPLYLPVQLENSVVNWELEEYLVGVLLAEMPASFEMEALKAQAVAARTYALKCHYKGYKHLGAICVKSTCCQGYCSVDTFLANGGTQEQVHKIRLAVSQTKGEVLIYGGALIEATYFACSGGKTEDAQAVWGTDVPYLQAVESPGEEQAPEYEQVKVYSAEELASLLGITTTVSPENWLGMVTYTDGGGVATMEIAGVTYRGTTLRSLLQLRSTMFSVEWTESGLLFLTRGHGHRVGMSQYGAEVMALDGSSYVEILKYYYLGTDVVQYEEISP